MRTARLSASGVRALLVAFGGLLLLYDVWCLAHVSWTSGWPPGDFFALWSFGRFALRFPLPLLYDDAALRAFQSWLGGVALDAPYPYPPHFALMLAPFALAGPIASYWVWMPLCLAAFFWAAQAGAGWPRWAVLAVLPGTAIGLAAGQNGFLSAALLIGGLRLSGRRPIRAGVLLGLLSYKPQLGLLAPVALAAAARWRALAAAAGTVALIGAIVGLRWGWESWIEWIEALRRHSRIHGAVRNSTPMMPTPAALFLLLGLSPPATRIAQAMAGLAAAGATWWAWRRATVEESPGREELAVAATCAATFLATPYAFHYDLPVLGVAVAIVLRAGLAARAGELGVLEALTLMVVALMPITLNAPDPRLPLGAPACAALLALASWMLRRRTAGRSL